MAACKASWSSLSDWSCPYRATQAEHQRASEKLIANVKQKGDQSVTFHLLLEDCLLPLERANVPSQGGGQALGFFLRLSLIFERAPSKVEGQVESSKLHGIFPDLGDHNLELVFGLIGVLMGFSFLGLEAHLLLLQLRHFGNKPLDLPLATEE